MAPLVAYIALRTAQQLVEHALARANHRYGLDPARQRHVALALGLDDGELLRATAYATDRHRHALVRNWTLLALGLGFLSVGGLGMADALARRLVGSLPPGGPWTGLVFFALLALASGLASLPFALHRTFRIEQRHGFNRQTLGLFLLDRSKAALLVALLGGLPLAAVLLLVEHGGPRWWLLAWIATSSVSLLTAWIYPTLLAPLFNRFLPLPQGELRTQVESLARRVGFRLGGVFVMDASRRSAHGNAFFTGLAGARRIVLFDTLVEALRPAEVVAVLAHELGHYKLGHVRRQILLGLLTSGAVFFLIGLELPIVAPPGAFGLARPSAHGALAVCALWLGLLEFAWQPLANALARRLERAADAFATRQVPAGDLARALLALRERSRLLPLVHPWYSLAYFSHPPLLERLATLGVPPLDPDGPPRQSSGAPRP